jgi:hypothetical protein
MINNLGGRHPALDRITRITPNLCAPRWQVDQFKRRRYGAGLERFLLVIAGILWAIKSPPEIGIPRPLPLRPNGSGPTSHGRLPHGLSATTPASDGFQGDGRRRRARYLAIESARQTELEL